MSGMKIVEVNGKEYLIGKFIGDDAVILSLKISKLVGGLFMGTKKSANPEELDLDFSKLDVDEVFKIAKQLLRVVYTSDNNCVADNMVTEFADGFSSLFPLIIEVIKVNNFLSLLMGLNKNLKLM